jgi:uncharacterized sulfatase
MRQNSPNIIVIFTDDQGYGQLKTFSDCFSPATLNPMGPTERYSCDVERAVAAAKKAMPNLDALAEGGVRFTHAYAASPLCGPSRVALMTGIYPQRYGVYCNIDLDEGLTDEATLLPALLKQKGYKNGMIGKWHIGKTTTEKLPIKTRDHHKNAINGCIKAHNPINRGFDYYFGFNVAGTNYYNSVDLFRNYSHTEAKGYLTEQFTYEALSFIEKNKTQPFFLCLAYNAPHVPLHEYAPLKYLERFDTGNLQVDNYYAYLAAVDDGIGEVVEKLKKLGIYKDTFIFFASDNGAVIDSPQPANGSFKGFKGQLWQGGIRVPMIAHWSGVMPENKTFEHPVSVMDIMPTALSAADIKITEKIHIDGVNLLPFLQGEKNEWSGRYLFFAGPQVLHWAEESKEFWKQDYQYIRYKRKTKPRRKFKYNNAAVWWAVRYGKWLLWYDVQENKYILNNVPGKGIEKRNLAYQYPQVVKRLTKRYGEWIQQMKKPEVWAEEKWKKLLTADASFI